MSSKTELPRPGAVSRPPADMHASERVLYVSAVATFAVAAALTIRFNNSMSGGMPMPGNWTMSMMWMAMPGKTWLEASLVFAGMWLAMMVAMMLPSALPMLLLYRRAAAFRGDSHIDALTLVLGAGYFSVWALFGVLAYAAGETVTSAVMKWPALSRLVPLAAGASLVLAGSYQFTPLKSACLKHCRDPLLLVAQHLHGGWRGSFRLGLHHGVFCALCCWGLMLIQLVLGVMNLFVMVAVALVIALEKILTRGELVARITGAGAILGGLGLVGTALLGA
jgi:predicted metal-binding membrane protein